VPTDLSRRDLLRLGLVVSAGAGLTACTTASSSGHPTQTDPGGPEDPDRALRAEVAAAEARLTALYATAATVLSGTPAARAAAVGQRHEAYRAAVQPASVSASASGATGAGPTPSLPAVSAGTASTVLVAAETAAAAARATQSARATDSELARVIVLAGAGAAAAAAVLSAGRAR
jgi:hypothetical protein